jgi:hypothetical protein
MIVCAVRVFGMPRGSYYTEWGVPWQNLRVNSDIMGNFSRFYLLSKDGSIPVSQRSNSVMPMFNADVMSVRLYHSSVIREFFEELTDY